MKAAAAVALLALAACAAPPKPAYDAAFWRSLAETLEQQERTKP